MSNTCEQLLLHGSCQLLLSTLLSEREMKMIPLLSSLFLVGRVLFYVGYTPRAPTNRGLGFSIGFMPILGALAVCWWRFVPQTLLALWR